MTGEKLLLQLLSDDLHALHASALVLEKDLHRLSLEIESDNIDSLAGLIAQINCAGFAPIESMMREAGIASFEEEKPARTAVNGVLGETRRTARRTRNQRIGAASAISVMRRAARYMEMYCTSVAESAMRLGLKALAENLRAWSREWIGLELNLNAVAARPRGALHYAEKSAYAA